MSERPHRLLIVDDDARLRDLLNRYLGEQGFEVKTVADSEQMKRAQSREHFDLIVLDLMLPGEDGLSICRRLRGTGDTTPIVMLTANALPEHRDASLAAGADLHMAKPIEAPKLFGVLQSVAERQAVAAAA